MISPQKARPAADAAQMEALVAAHPWEATPLGPVEAWPPGLRVAVAICLESRFPMILWWGEELRVLYNDAYIPIWGDKHPAVLGQPGVEAWGEIWDTIGPKLARVMDLGEPSWSDDELLLLERYGFSEEAYFTFSYSPIRLESGAVGGVFTAVNETTARVLSVRRLATLRNLGSLSLAGTPTVGEVCQRAVDVLTGNRADVPFAAIYLPNDDEGGAHLMARGGEPIPSLPDSITADDPAWAVVEVMATRQLSTVDAEGRRCSPAHVGSGRAGACVVPLGHTGTVLIAGMSARRRFDDSHRDFLDLARGHMAGAMVAVDAYESERRRAEALADLDRAKTAFFQNVSHEFRTPLTLMLGPLDALSRRRDPLPDDALTEIATAGRNARRLLGLVNSLLDFSRLASGGTHATFRPTQLAEVTSDIAAMFRSAIHAAGLELVVDCPPLATPVYVDPAMWETVVVNLMSNALKFTLSGSITVALSAVDDRIELEVSDTGEGIAANEIPRLFNRFHRVEGVAARTAEGSGIGLATVSELVKLHGGDVGVTSIAGQGSTFTVSMPLGSAHLPGDQVREDSVPMELSRAEAASSDARSWGADPIRAPVRSGSEPLPGRSRILVADDNVDMRAYLRRLLAEDYEVVVVNTGDEALRVVGDDPPDLVVTDVMMPGLSGLDLVRAIKANPMVEGLPVLVLSARAGDEAAAEGLDIGADDYLVKPFSAAQLLARVRSCLEQSRTQAEQRRLDQDLLALDATILDHIARNEPLSTVLDLLVRSVEQLIPGIAASILLLDDDGRHVRVGAAPSLPADYRTAIDGSPVGPDVGSAGTAASHEAPVVAVDIASDPLWADFAALAAIHGVAACWSTPIRTGGGDLVGILALHHRRPQQPQGFETDLMTAATRLASVAIEHARAEAALIERSAQLARSQAMAHVGNWELDPATMAMKWSDELFRIFGMEPGEVEPSLGALLDRIPEPERSLAAEAVGAVLSTGGSGSFDHRIITPTGAERVVHANFGMVEGAGGSVRRLEGTKQDVTGLKLAQEALHEREALWLQERQIAQSLQRSLLPDPDLAQPGLAVAARYLAGAEGMEVGGDWYDVFPLGDGTVGFAVGDIVGRGLSAAATMGQLRTALRSYALVEKSPAAVLARLNQLVESLGRGELATVVYGVYDPASRLARLACAGHPPPLVIEPEQAPRFVWDGRGPPLGVGNGPAADAVLALATDATLLLYTDGLIERRGRNLDEGLAALIAAASAEPASAEPASVHEAPAAAARPASAEAPSVERLCDCVLAALVGDAVSDDVALLALAPVGVAENEFRLSLPARPTSLVALRRVLQGWLHGLGATDEERSDVVLAVNEAVANSVAHAYGLGASGLGPSRATVEVVTEVKDRRLLVSVADQGTWRRPSSRGGGRGLSIMASLMEVAVEASEAGTCVRLTRILGQPFQPRPHAVLSSSMDQGSADRVATGLESSGNGSAERVISLVTLPEEVDLANAARVAVEISRSLNHDAFGLIVDGSHTRYLDSAGLRVLFDAASRLAARRQQVRLVLCDPGIERLMALTDTDGLLAYSSSVGQAERDIRRKEIYE
ncbi:MAG: SpoIIE family protein phosphatase [Acidimicrobiales bacterium]